MPRKPRFVLPGVPQHVIQRGHNREPYFYSEDDYVRYLDRKLCSDPNGTYLSQNPRHCEVRSNLWQIGIRHK